MIKHQLIEVFEEVICMRVQRALNERYYPNLEKAIWEGGIKKRQ